KRWSMAVARKGRDGSDSTDGTDCNMSNGDFVHDRNVWEIIGETGSLVMIPRIFIDGSAFSWVEFRSKDWKEILIEQEFVSERRVT
ncbi:4583_t:CDS:2, partial [Funneliformis geosporum]